MTGQKRYEVVVVGGGVAGVAAALQCARSGLRTAIVEKTVLWGGLATSGLVPIYMPLCDGCGRQVTFGIAEELLRLSVKYGPGGILGRRGGEQGTAEGGEDAAAVERLYPRAKLGDRYMALYSPASFVLGLDEVLASSGAELWLDTLACRPVMRGRRLTALEVENKSGRILLRAACFVDCSGDADVAYRCGAPCRECGSHPTYLVQHTSLGRVGQAVRAGSARRLIGWRGRGDEMEDGDRAAGRKFSAVSGRDVSRFVMECRRLAREDLASEHSIEAAASRQTSYFTALASMAQCRRSRRIDGVDTIRPDQRNQACPDSIGMIADCRQRDAVWEVPYGALLPRGVDNLLAAGRCSSAEGYAWHVARLIPAAALTGQVAGVAAGVAMQRGTLPGRLDAADVQEVVASHGIELHR